MRRELLPTLVVLLSSCGETPPRVVTHEAPRSPTVGELVDRGAASCSIGPPCGVRDCVDLLDQIERRLDEHPDELDDLVAATPGKDDRAIVALDLLNGVLTRWRHDGKLADRVDATRRHAIVDQGLRNACAGVLLSPLLMPGGALDPGEDDGATSESG